ncbi:MAG TPA: glycoside hydrolase domain-containing protein [Rhodanobacteraceae bacterium]
MPSARNTRCSATHATALHVRVPSGTFAASSLIRVPRFGNGFPSTAVPSVLRLASVRNARVSAQLVVASSARIDALRATVSALVATHGAVIPAADVEVRYVGYVPFAPRNPKAGGATLAQVGGNAVSERDGKRVVADPLWPRGSVDVPANAAQPIWFTFRIRASVPPGVYRGHIVISAAHARSTSYALTLTVNPPVLPDPGDGAFHFNVWFNPDAVATAYHVRPWSSAHWNWIRRYFRFLAKAGQRSILTTIVPQPWRVAWNGWKPQTAVGYDSMVQWAFNGTHWTFDFRRFDRYVQTALAAGLGPKIVAYSMLSFRGPQRLTYLDTRSGRTQHLTPAVGSPLWEYAWCAFTRAFATHLRQRGWLDHTWLGFDERPAAILQPALALLRRCAPEFLRRTELAGTQKVGPYAQDLSLGLSSPRQVSNAWILQRHRHGKVTTFYTWAGDVHPNTLTFSPAVEAREMGWIAARRHLDGYLHWAFDDWPPDVFKHPVYAFSQGDEYLVYPGPRGPVSSIRWKLLQEGVEDAELAHMARQRAPHSPALQAALRLATRNAYTGHKDVHDIARAHTMLVALLDRAR